MTRKKFSVSLIALFIALLTAGVAFAQGQNQQGTAQNPENSLFYNIGNDHRDVAILFNRLETMVAEQDQMGGGQQATDTQALFDELTTALLAHGAAAEQTLYQTLADNQTNGTMDTMGSLSDLGMQLAIDLHVANLQLWELRNTTMDSGIWLSKFRVLEDNVTSHFKREVLYGYSEGMAALDDQQATQLGQQYQTIKQQTITEIESQDLNTYLEQALCEPILGEDQGFCITTDSGMNGGQTGGDQTGGGQTDDGEETTS
ncbi:hemerythrin domain-containing protein [Desulfocurvibacter africanus]|uniref:hemerythrin domain-containing protein n=1 Tax=Desulfocurvibacter africanus TaxID=873 RepID=UPI0003FF205E|nr:hemerythrin domain-containing protein [Desulfocurvibacter africanus]